MKLEELAGRCGVWLRGSGPESDIVVSSRIRLARNLADYPFIRRCSDHDLTSIENHVRSALRDVEELSSSFYVDVHGLSPLDRQLLVERQLISREHASGRGARGAAIDQDEQYSVMINEEDHLRLQVMGSGLDLDETWRQVDRLDDALSERLAYAFSDKRGYLTACPTNVGTGLRVSVMLHLPALVITREIEKVFRGLQKISLAVRGLYGEGSQAMGDFYQISNQITLGYTEHDLIERVREVVNTLIAFERKARDYLLNESQDNLNDKVAKAFEHLSHAKDISSEETMALLSSVRMGVNLGLIRNLEMPTINKLFIHTQPAHLQKLRGNALDKPGDRNVERAHYLQEQLKSVLGPDASKS